MVKADQKSVDRGCIFNLRQEEEKLNCILLVSCCACSEPQQRQPDCCSLMPVDLKMCQNAT